ncbi:MAG: hypothetical protein H0T62_11165 [Parachlamydiaceae bacterium]|nr:hypothetical protein [Parachlamydiaceae bacterium]
MIKKIFNKFEEDRLSFSPVKGDPWNGPVDHFWKTFAEEFLEEIDHYLTHLNEMASNENVLENQLLTLQLKRKLALEVPQTALLEILNNHPSTQNKKIVKF